MTQTDYCYHFRRSMMPSIVVLQCPLYCHRKHLVHCVWLVDFHPLRQCRCPITQWTTPIRKMPRATFTATLGQTIQFGLFSQFQSLQGHGRLCCHNLSNCRCQFAATGRLKRTRVDKINSSRDCQLCRIIGQIMIALGGMQIPSFHDSIYHKKEYCGVQSCFPIQQIV